MGVRASMSIVGETILSLFVLIIMNQVNHGLWGSLGSHRMPFVWLQRDACFFPCPANASLAEPVNFAKYREAQLCSPITHPKTSTRLYPDLVCNSTFASRSILLLRSHTLVATSYLTPMTYLAYSTLIMVTLLPMFDIMLALLIIIQVCS
jgi:hypothetical protein